MKRKKIIVCLCFLALLMVSGPIAFAADPKIVTGTKNFFTDAGKWVLILTPIAGGTMIGYHALMKGLSEGDAGTIADRNKKMVNVLKAVAIAECATGIITAFIAYFK